MNRSPNKFESNSGLSSEKGFSLIEATIALVILLIVLLGVSAAMVYAVRYNNANYSRSKTLAVLQQEEENLRSAKFTSAIIDSVLLGGVKSPKSFEDSDGDSYRIETTIDDDPNTAGVQIDGSQTLKQITLTAIPLNDSANRQSSIPASVIFRRVRSN